MIKLYTQKIDVQLLEHWKREAERRKIPLAELVRIAMKKEVGMSPKELQELIDKRKTEK